MHSQQSRYMCESLDYCVGFTVAVADAGPSHAPVNKGICYLVRNTTKYNKRNRKYECHTSASCCNDLSYVVPSYSPFVAVTVLTPSFGTVCRPPRKFRHRPRDRVRVLVTQNLEGPISAVSKPIFAIIFLRNDSKSTRSAQCLNRFKS